MSTISRSQLLSDLITAETGIVQAIDVILDRPAAAVPGDATNFAVDIYGSAGAGRAPLEIIVHRLDFEEVLESSQTSIYQRAVAQTEAITSAVIGMRVVAGSAGAALELIALSDPGGESTSIARIAADELLLEGSVDVDFLTVDGLLTLSTEGAFSTGKVSPDDEADGLFFGRYYKDASDQGFALAASRTSGSGIPQQMLLTQDEFAFINPTFRVSAASVDAVQRKTANMAATALTGKSMIRITSAIGGGGGGRGGSGSAGVSGSAGRQTIIKLYDGATLKQTITANGGSGGAGNASSPSGKLGAAGIDPGNRGGGGNGGSWTDDESRGRSGAGGSRGQIVSKDWIDISGWAAPKIEITIGAGGAGGGNGSAGTGGAASYQTMEGTVVPANVVPLFGVSGTITKTTAAGSFPPLGAGIWILYRAGADIDLTTVDLGDGVALSPIQGRCVTLISSDTPTYGANSGSYSIAYRFFRMGEWG